MKQIEELLKHLGFKHMAGPLWKHDSIGVITVTENDTPETLVSRIYNRGYGDCQETIKRSLGIKP